MLEYDRRSYRNEKELGPYLDNILGIEDIDELLKVEYSITAKRALEIQKKGFFDNKNMDMNTMKNIHKKLFQDIYPWAGEIRDVEIMKGGNTFYPFEFLNNGIQEIFNDLKRDNYLDKLDQREFVELFCYYSNEFNVLHPFREGNGRTKRIFMTELAKRAGYDINLDKLDAEQLRDADIAAFGDQYERKAPNMYKLKVLISSNIKEIKTHNIPKMDGYERLNRLLWVYDRDLAKKWCRQFNSMSLGVEKIKLLVLTKQGRDEIVEHLQQCRYGSKPLSIRDTVDRYIEKFAEYENTKHDYGTIDLKDDDITK